MGRTEQDQAFLLGVALILCNDTDEIFGGIETNNDKRGLRAIGPWTLPDTFWPWLASQGKIFALTQLTMIHWVQRIARSHSVKWNLSIQPCCCEAKNDKNTLRLRMLFNFLLFTALLAHSCQSTQHSNGKRIVGGKDAVRGKYPSYGIPTGSVLCGATLIAPDLMISAAHCKGAFTSGPSAVAIGGTKLKAEDAEEILGVAYEVTHPEYDPNTAANDVMLVKLDMPAKTEPVRVNGDPSLPIDGGKVCWTNVRVFLSLKPFLFASRFFPLVSETLSSREMFPQSFRKWKRKLFRMIYAARHMIRWTFRLIRTGCCVLGSTGVGKAHVKEILEGQYFPKAQTVPSFS